MFKVSSTLIYLALMLVASDYLFHTSLSPCLIFFSVTLSLSLSLCIYVLFSAVTSPGRCIAVGSTRDYGLYSSLLYSFYFSCSVAVFHIHSFIITFLTR